MAESKPNAQDWAALLVLSLIWGGSFFFVGVAVKELPALLIVFARVGLAALILVPIHIFKQGGLPRDGKTWIACGSMAMLNNVLPFTAIAWGQHAIGSGLASVINATSPMFAAGFMALFGLEVLALRKLIALLLGLVGVVALEGARIDISGAEGLGILAVTFASACYGLSTCWSKVRLMGVAPLTAATCQICTSAVVMGILAFSFSTPSLYLQVSFGTLACLVALAALSTVVAYLIFFWIMRRAGPSFTILVTLIIPVSAVILGLLFLNELFTAAEAVGSLLIGLALLLIDGRLPRRLGLKLA